MKALGVKLYCRLCKNEITNPSLRTYCSKKCYREFKNKNKRELYKKNIINRFPEYACQECGQKIKLDFEPLKNPRLLDNLKCSNKNCKNYEK